MWSPQLLRFTKTASSPHLSLVYLQQRLFNNLPLAYNTENDPAPYFFSPKVQRLLKYLTRVDHSKVFRHRTNYGEKILETPEYKFMTDKQLQEEIEKMKTRAERLLQMPPVIQLHDNTEHIISKDHALGGYDTAKYIFTDISINVENKNRICFIRETDGTLKRADREVQKRMCQTYFPMRGRTLKEPSMVADESLFNKLLEKKSYEFILDKACIQYEPDELQFHHMTAKVYQHCNLHAAYELLRSTRHFGPMAFYFAWHNSIDGLLLELLQTNVIRESVALVSLQRIMHPGLVQTDETKALVEEILDPQASTEIDLKRISNDEINLDEKCITCIDNYINKNSTKKAQQDLALQGLRELYKQRIKVEHGIRAAHGVS
ncbi:mitochondrial ribosomal protein S22 [Arctopsyche grandis]|uniref:mitochondrial ribosomal protein S22 n=1 Tax=Arctopsyche grandis TaxID=121162 RepID=UPI00406D6BEE